MEDMHEYMCCLDKIAEANHVDDYEDESPLPLREERVPRIELHPVEDADDKEAKEPGEDMEELLARDDHSDNNDDVEPPVT